MIFSSAYAAVVSTLTPLTTAGTVLISDELNHNCIINAMRLSRPAGKVIYRHNQVEDIDRALTEWRGRAERALVVTDGVFSMRGDHAPPARDLGGVRRARSSLSRERGPSGGRLPRRRRLRS